MGVCPLREASGVDDGVVGDVDDADELISPSSALDESEQLLQAQALLGARALAARLSERMTLVSALHRRLEKSSLLQPHGEQAPTAQSSRAQTSSPPAPAKAKKERRPPALEQLQRSQYSKAGLAVQAYEGFDPAASTPRRLGGDVRKSDYILQVQLDAERI